MSTPKKGVRPDFVGVPGRLVDEAPPDVVFGRKSKLSPYDPLLLQLQKAGAGKFLKFDDLRAKSSLIVRAKKLGIKILFGEQGSTLWVALAKAELSQDGNVQQPSAPKARPLPEIVLEAISNDKRDTPGLIVSYCRLHGAPEATLNAVDSSLATLLRQGRIKLKAKPRSAPDDQDRWVSVI